jgi:hypothetical protein
LESAVVRRQCPELLFNQNIAEIGTDIRRRRHEDFRSMF